MPGSEMLQQIIERLDSGEWNIISAEIIPDWLGMLAAQQHPLLFAKLVHHVYPVCAQSWDGAYAHSGAFDAGTSTLHVVWRVGDVVSEAHVDIDRCGKRKETV